MIEMKFELGVQVKDVISGLVGYTTGYVTYITGCNQYLVQPTGNGKSKPEPSWVDESRLIKTSKGSQIKLDNGPVGFDKQAPVR